MWKWNRIADWLSAPDEGGGAASGATAPAAPAAPAAAPAPAPAAASAPAPAEPVGQQGTPVSTADQYAAAQAAAAAGNPATAIPPAVQVPAVAPAAAAAPGAPSPAAATPPITIAGVRDYARSVGIDPANYADDATMLRDLVAAGQQAQAFRTQAQQLAQQQAALMQRLNVPVAQPVPQPPAGGPVNPLAKFWNAPEYQPAWEQLVTRDAAGQVTGVKPGVPIDILPKYLAYQNYRRDFADRLTSNPIEALGPMVQHMAQEQAGKLIEQHMKTYQDQTWTDNFLAQNTQWLHARDAAGNQIMNAATGKPMLSPVGQAFSNFVSEAEQLGITDIRRQEVYARNMLHRQQLMGQTAAAAAPVNGAAAAAAAIAAGNRRAPNQTGTVPGTGPIPATVPQNAGLSLREQLAQAMQQQGITDEQVNL